MIRPALSLLLLMAMAGCGQSGDLFIPEQPDNTEEAGSGAEAEAAPAENGEEDDEEKEETGSR
jgi:predicted small lipoprotein YifL